MTNIQITIIFFLILVLVSIQYTLNKILVELKKINIKFDTLLNKKGGNDGEEYSVK